MNFTHIFFDLDHTLWDYDKNANFVLTNLYDEFGLSKYISASSSEFVDHFFTTNDSLWTKYNQGLIGRDDIRLTRFQKVLEGLGCEEPLDHLGMNDYFLYQCPRQSEIMEGAEIILGYLSKKYHLSIITNGFDDVQSVKLKACGLGKYFSHVFTSESTGYKKPAREIFDFALTTVAAERENALMIGDNPMTDILGATNAGITPLLYNPTGTVKSECELQVNHLSELMKIL